MDRNPTERKHKNKNDSACGVTIIVRGDENSNSILNETVCISHSLNSLRKICIQLLLF